MLPKNRIKLLLNMLLIAGQTIPRGGTLTVDGIGSGEATGFSIRAAGTNAKVAATVMPLLAGEGGDDGVDAHRIQPFYTGLLARACGLTVNVTTEADAVVVATS
jgi:histidine phosphotransferase ChpT